MVVYFVVAFIFEHIWETLQFVRGLLGFAVKPKPARWTQKPWRFVMLCIGIVGLFMLTVLLWDAARRPPFEGVFRKFGSALLVMTDFSYDKTCAVSSQTRLVAPLKDRKDLEGTKVLIADASSWTHIQFSIGQCK